VFSFPGGIARSALAGSACALPGVKPGAHVGLAIARTLHIPCMDYQSHRWCAHAFLPPPPLAGRLVDPWWNRRIPFAARTSPKEVWADVPIRRSDAPGARVLCATPQGAHSLVCGFGDHLTVTTLIHLLSHVFPELLDCLRLHFPRFANRPQRHWLSLEGGISRRVFRHLLRETP
jgi:hypothetical protein